MFPHTAWSFSHHRSIAPQVWAGWYPHLLTPSHPTVETGLSHTSSSQGHGTKQRAKGHPPLTQETEEGSAETGWYQRLCEVHAPQWGSRCKQTPRDTTSVQWLYPKHRQRALLCVHQGTETRTHLHVNISAERMHCFLSLSPAQGRAERTHISPSSSCLTPMVLRGRPLLSGAQVQRFAPHLCPPAQHLSSSHTDTPHTPTVPHWEKPIVSFAEAAETPELSELRHTTRLPVNVFKIKATKPRKCI